MLFAIDYLLLYLPGAVRRKNKDTFFLVYLFEYAEFYWANKKDHSGQRALPDLISYGLKNSVGANSI
jgi:hypothetical protein